MSSPSSALMRGVAVPWLAIRPALIAPCPPFLAPATTLLPAPLATPLVTPLVSPAEFLTRDLVNAFGPVRAADPTSLTPVLTPLTLSLALFKFLPKGSMPDRTT